jgi:hypothetical protein
MYPIYQGTYERHVKFSLDIEMMTEWYKDAARSIDYLATRPDIDGGRLAYLGVSFGSAVGVIATTLLQDRFKTAIFLEGGYFLGAPIPGGDQADFAPRMKKPILMVNGRYDSVFSLDQAQNPLCSTSHIEIMLDHKYLLRLKRMQERFTVQLTARKVGDVYAELLASDCVLERKSS